MSGQRMPGAAGLSISGIAVIPAPAGTLRTPFHETLGVVSSLTLRYHRAELGTRFHRFLSPQMNERTHRIRYHSEAVHGGRLRVFSTQRAGIQMVLALVMFVFIMAVGACGSSEDSPPVEVDAPLSLNGSAPMAHGDHSAKHGGFVYMHGDLHYEVLLSGDGHHQIYLSDATRVDLPASAIANAVLEIPREGGDLEVLELAIDDFGESWEARGAPITDSATVATLRFSFQNEPYEIELPFVPPADADVMNPHTGKQ